VVLTGWRPTGLGRVNSADKQNGAWDEDSAKTTQEDHTWCPTNDPLAHLVSTGQNHCAEVLAGLLALVAAPALSVAAIGTASVGTRYAVDGQEWRKVVDIFVAQATVLATADALLLMIASVFAGDRDLAWTGVASTVLIGLLAIL